MKLMILRHAPALTGGRLAGRSDVAADCSDGDAFVRIRDRIGAVGTVLTSPARRCRQTAAALGWPDAPARAGLWEQDFGLWEGRPYADLPELGPLPPARLARHRPEGGESFEDMAARVQAEIGSLTGDTLLIAHAGTVRAALAIVVGPAALAFTVAPLSLTTLIRAGQDWAVEAVNLVSR